MLQALVGLAVLLQFNRFTDLVGIASLAVVAVYPFMKRVTYWPQIVLGLAFSWGALMGWPATFGAARSAGLLLYAGSIAWVIGYDTIYAHQDREDDALIGIKSTALLFGERTKPMLALFYALAVVLIALAGWSAGAGLVFALGPCSPSPRISPGRSRRLDIDDPVNCLVVFKSNRDAGLILFAGFVADAARARRLIGARPTSHGRAPRVAPCARSGQADGARTRAAASAGGRLRSQSRAMKRQPLIPSDCGDGEPHHRHAHDLGIEQHRRARLAGREEAGGIGRAARHQDVHGHAGALEVLRPGSRSSLRARPWRRRRRRARPPAWCRSSSSR